MESAWLKHLWSTDPQTYWAATAEVDNLTRQLSEAREEKEHFRSLYIQTTDKHFEEIARLRKALEATREYLMGGKWIYEKSPDEFIKAALEASNG